MTVALAILQLCENENLTLKVFAVWQTLYEDNMYF